MDVNNDKPMTSAKAERTYDGVLKRYDLPREEALKRLAEITQASQGRSKLYFKFTCEGCKARCMFGTPNELYEAGICPECGHETTLAEVGFMVVTDFAQRVSPTITANDHDSDTTNTGTDTDF